MILNVKDKKYNNIVKDIIRNQEFKKMANITHHGITRLEHSLKVSYKSYKLAQKLNLDYISVARAGLLHDFYLDGNERRRLKKITDTFTHPKKALKTSINNFELNKKEENIIFSHMFPICPMLPTYKESFLVALIDKYIGFKEMSINIKDIFKYRINYSYLLIILFLGSN